MIRRVTGTTAVITGATSGIGRDTALEFARAGAKVVIAGRREERLRELASEIEAKGGEALAVRSDVSDEASVNELVGRAVDRFGRIDTLVNNAGVGLAAKFVDQSLEDFRRVMDVNFWGAVYACRAAVPVMRKQDGGGVIINVSSIFGKRGMPFETAYSASKFALAGFSEALRAELMSEAIDVVAVYPGAVETEIFESAANRTGIDIPSAFPKFPSRQMAQIIVQSARVPMPEVVMALDAQAIDLARKFVPGLLDLALGWTVPFIDGMRRNSSGSDINNDKGGNLYDPQNEKKKQ